MSEMIGEEKEKFGPANPHPAFGVDDNIANEAGHTNYPKYVHQFDEKGKIVGEDEIIEKVDDKGRVFKSALPRKHSSRIVNNADEEAEAEAEGFLAVWVKPKADKKSAGWK